MPILRSAIKKMRQDAVRTAANRAIRTRIRTLLTTVRKSKDPQGIVMAYSVLDRAAKKRVIHPNTASRLKSRLAQAVPPAT